MAFATLGVGATHGVGAHGRSLLYGKVVEAVQCQRLRQRADVDAVRDEHDLHV
jgi:hypothetical protein